MRIYSREEVAQSAAPERLWVIVHGKVLDVTRWAKTHPGGAELLLAFGGRDCSEVFDAFHRTRVRRRLAEFQIGTLASPQPHATTKCLDADEMPPPAPRAPDEKLRKLRETLEARGAFEPRAADVVVPLARALAFLALGLAFFIAAPREILAGVAGGVCVGLFEQQSLLLAHDALHGAVFRSRRATFWGGWFFGTVCGGVGAAWWRRDHFAHHALTNVLGRDPSAGVDPFVFIDSKQFAAKPRAWWERTLLRAQPWTYAPLCALLARPNLHLVSVAASPRPLVDGAGVLAYLAWNLAVYARLGSPACAWFAAHLACSALHFQLNVGHYAGGMWPQRTLDDVGFFAFQLLTTRNIACSAAQRWFHGGLEKQIEHHVFPLLPRSRLAEVSGDVRRIASDRGLSYGADTFWRESLRTWRRLSDVSRARDKTA